MNELLVVIDMQNDFVTGVLGSEAACAIMPYVEQKIQWHREEKRGPMVFTLDTHGADFPGTLEGQRLPVAHCEKGSEGWRLCPEVAEWAGEGFVFEKSTFGSASLVAALAAEHAKHPISSITLIGLCTDICVISNAMLLRAYLPNVPICVDALCCAGSSREGHEAALAAMRPCLIDTVFETERLLLRPWHAPDAAALYKYASNPNVGPIAGWPEHQSLENSQSVIQTVLSAPENYAITLKETGEPIGSIGLMTREGVHTAAIGDNETEVGYWIGEPYWGQGLATEAVGALLRHSFLGKGFAAVWSGYYDGNDRSRRVQEKCGFEPHHTEHNKDCPLLGERRTEHFTMLKREEWLLGQR